MTDIEQRAAKMLDRIRYAPNIWHEPRAKTLYRLSQSCPHWNLTALEQADLWFLIWHYRRQVNDTELIGRAGEVVNGQVALRF
jgi:hypothetical protein